MFEDAEMEETENNEESTSLSGDEDSVLREELKLLLEVQQGLLLEASEDKEDPELKNQFGEIIEIRDSLAEARTEDLPALMAQMERMVILKHQQQNTQSSSFIDPESPYFGHMRLLENARERDLLIGSGNCFSSHLPCPIVDWRQSPISRIFFKYREGDDYVEEIGDREIEGEVICRRMLVIEEGHVQRITWNGGMLEERHGRWVQGAQNISRLKGGTGSATRPFEEEFIAGRLGRSKGPKHYSVDKHLKQITALIDQQQFDVITQPESGVILIQGGAGSGKTTVALHRMAYLISQKTGYFKSDTVMPVVFGPALANYIGKVLPSLGIHGVKPRVYQEWSSRLRARLFPELPSNYSESTPVAVIQFKRHPFLLKWFGEVIGQREQQFQKELFSKTSAYGESQLVQDLWKQLEPYPLVPKVKRLLQWSRGNRVAGNIEPCTNPSLMQSLEALVEDQFPGFKQNPDGLVIHLWNDCFLFWETLEQGAKKHIPDDFTEGQLRSVWSWCVRQYQRRTALSGENEISDRESVVESLAAQGLSQGSSFMDEQPSLDEEDDTLLLLLHQLLIGPILRKNGKPLRYTHLMIDEAQDFSPLEMQLLINLSPTDRPSITLAGDMDQRILIGNRHENWESVLEHLNVDVKALDPLTVGYRSTHEIMTVAKSVIGRKTVNTEWRAVRHGAPVERFSFRNQGALILFLSDALEDLQIRESQASVAVLTRELDAAEELYRGLVRADVPNMRLIKNQEFTFKPGIEITDIAQTKGLEFDYVILTDADASTYGIDEASRHLLYVGVTRAAHQLWLLHTGNPSGLLPEINVSNL